MMNKDEAVHKLSKVARISMSYAEDLYDSFFPKPVVPQYVAGWIKYCKFTNVNLGRALFISDIDFYNYEGQEDCSKLKEFLGTETNQETFALAWTLGYEVEEETKYTVRVKATNQYLCNDAGVIHFSPGFRTDFTKNDLEKLNLGWVFDCEGIEIEEVTDGND